MSWLILILGLLAAQQSSTPSPPATQPAANQSSLDYEFFKTRVQPIFLAKRPGHARCITCHERGQPRLQELSPGASTWNEEQSRQNFVEWQRVVVPGDPDSSRLLTHPLAKAAGGDVFHGGGRHWQSKSDPEYQTLVAFVRTGATQVTSAAADGLDFATYRARIEPIFLKERGPNEGAGMCVNCHSRIATRMRLQPLSPGATSWTEAQSRQNFEAVKRVVVPGDATKSPLAVHPLAASAGGDAQHTGGKFWTSKDNPEYAAVEAWIRSAAPAASTPTATLDYEVFKTRIQPVFLAKRPGHARCITCHERGTPRLAELSPGATTWNEAQSRQNFAAWQRVIVPGDPLSSRLLMHPLAKSAGGDVFHGGGKHWQSQSDPEFQMIAAWIKGEGRGQALDYEFFKASVQPLLVARRSGNARCVTCHRYEAPRMLELSPGTTAYTEEQSRQNFAVWQTAVSLGNPTKSRILTRPLAKSAGGDVFHVGGKPWKTQSDPEYQVLAAWVRGESIAASSR